MIRSFFILVLFSVTAQARIYTTSFPATENPISQGGRWLNGQTNGSVWKNCRSTPGLVFGTQTGAAPPPYDDSTAVLTGTWGQTQTAMGRVRTVNQVAPGSTSVFQEVELRLRSTITANSITGYEVLFACRGASDGQRYVQIVKWNGALNSFTQLNGQIGPGLNNGDVVKATISGSTITAYINGVSVCTATDSTFTGGSPGVGFFNQGGTAAQNADYGFTSFAASDQGDILMANSVSTTDVQNAVNTSADGGLILVPNGTASWSSGITTNKQILIQAENTIPTPAGPGQSGALSRNVTLTNNSSNAMFTFTSGNSFPCGIGGIRFNEGTGNQPHVSLDGTGTKVPLIYDCYFENKSRNFPAESAILITCKGGVMWNCYGKGTFDVNIVGESFLKIKLGGNGFATASTMGTLDTGGLTNYYIEDSTFKDAGLIDMDNSARMVVRHAVFDGSWAETHGFTSIWGGRWWEFYDMTWQSTTTSRNLSKRYFWCRAGSGIFTNCVVNNATDTQSYGSITLLSIGDNQTPAQAISSVQSNQGLSVSGYLIPRQPGSGNNGGTALANYVSDPIYLWNNTGTQAYTWGFQPDPGDWSTVVQNNRDLFVNNGAKPGFTKFTYPHPMRLDQVTAVDTTPPTISTRSVNGTAWTFAASEVVQIGSGGTGGWTVNMSGGAVTLSNIQASGANITATGSRAVLANETGTASYTQPGNGVEDSAGNDLASFSAQSVTNLAVDNPPALNTPSINTAGTTLTLPFTEAVQTGAGGSTGWTMTASGGTAVLTFASGTGSPTLLYTISRPIQFGESVTISYVQPGNGIEDVSGGIDLANITNRAVTNSSVQGQVIATPVITLPAGTYTTAQTTTITCATPAAVIHYTTNGTTPTGASPTYSTPISIPSTMTIKSMATKTGGYTDSGVASSLFTINITGLPSARYIGIRGVPVAGGATP